MTTIKPRLGNVFQIVSNIAVVLGLLFVGFQLFQDRELKTAELAFASLTSSIEATNAQLGENTADVIEKSIESPSSLTYSELYQLKLVYESELYVYRQIHVMQSMGIFSEGIGNEISPVFMTEPGKRFLKQQLPVWRLGEDRETTWSKALSDPTFTQGLEKQLASIKSTQQ